MKYYLGMDIGGTKCAVVLSDEKADRIIDKIRFDTAHGGWEEVTEKLISSAHEILSRNGITADDVLTCGVSCGGPLDSGRGIIMSPPNLPGWDNVPLADIITERLGIKCKIRNDADACALAEWQSGAGKGTRNMIFLTFGTGMGAGLILDGKLYSGSGGNAGEVGHIRLSETGPEGYGKAGSFEGFCSGGGISRMAQAMYSEYGSGTMLEGTDFSAKTIAEKAELGDSLSLAVYEKCAEMLGKGLAVLVDILNPEAIVIGSIYQRSSALLREGMLKSLKEEALTANAAECRIIPAALGDDIGDFAAIGTARDYWESENGKCNS